MSSGGARAGEGAPGSRATGATAAVSFGSEEAGTGSGAEAGGGTDAATGGSRADTTGGSRAGAVAAGAGASGATAAALGLEEIGIVEMTRGTAFGASRMSIGCSFSLEPALVMDVWLELLCRISLLFRTMLLGPVPALMIGGSAGNTDPPNMAR